jgi:hypothetical protein
MLTTLRWRCFPPASHNRDTDDDWTTRVAINGGRVEIFSLKAELIVDEIYRNSAVR